MISFKVLSFSLYVGLRLKRIEGKSFDRKGKMINETFRIFFFFRFRLKREREGVKREERERVMREKREKEREDLGFNFFCFIFLKVQLQCKICHFKKSLSSHQICS